MAVGTTSPWPDIGDQLDETYKKEYFFHQAFENDNFMDILIPPKTYINAVGDEVDIVDKFFGVKSLNIFIAQQNYGWQGEGSDAEFVWDDPGSDFSIDIQDALDRWEEMRPRFASYKCLIWFDMYTANQVKMKYPDSKYPEMLQRSADKFESVFADIEGFEYMGTIDDLPQENFFFDAIDSFYKKPAYKVQDEE